MASLLFILKRIGALNQHERSADIPVRSNDRMARNSELRAGVCSVEHIWECPRSDSRGERLAFLVLPMP
jgi:hypothetical protein